MPGSDPRFPGGDTTGFDRSLNAFNKLAKNTQDQDRILKFGKGNKVFKAVWSENSEGEFSGLGPFFQSSSCNGCHFLSGRGKRKVGFETKFSSAIFKIGTNENFSSTLQHPIYGNQIQENSTSPQILPKAKPEVSYQTITGQFPDGEPYQLEKPILSVRDWNYGDPGNYVASMRVAPFLIGLGLLSAIREEDLKKWEDPDDKNGDGISGRINWIKSTEVPKIGRFGWKASFASVSDITINALGEDMGILNSSFLKSNCPISTLLCESELKPEISDSQLDDLIFYTMLIAVPVRVGIDSSSIQLGSDLFNKIGCSSCHIPQVKTGELDGYPEVSNQMIYPYTDLLLHEMGAGLADPFSEGSAGGSEWRTPPLWGMGLIPLVNQHEFLLHDGRARNITEAILWHGGEAEGSKNKFIHLSSDERKALIQFLNSL
ncbi:MAG: thiol oxidoreductase [Leptospiraceae bacterium]|nr:thiol oxidoreductase [Leptospiraceae bacterium]